MIPEVRGGRTSGGVAASAQRAARRAFWIFLAVAVVCSAQVSWWAIHQIGDTHTITELRLAQLDAERHLIGDRLVEHYGHIWHALDSLTRDPNRQGAIPSEIVRNPAVQSILKHPPVARSTMTPLGRADARVWNWAFDERPHTRWVVLDPQYPSRFISQFGDDFTFTGDAPRSARRPWPLGNLPVALHPDKLAEVERQRQRTTFMFISEGAFFVLLIVLGAYMIYRTVRQSADLRRRQHNFVAAVTHELKAPLAAVKLYAETLERPEISRDDQTTYLKRMIEDINRLEELIDNTLLAGRLEEKGFHLNLKRTDFSRDVQEYVETLQGFLERYDFNLRTEIAPDIEAVTDYDAMRRVFSCIVGNAVKYSDKRREADLSLGRDGRHILLSVRDYGVGVPPEELDRVFDAFYRVGDELTRKLSGTGLGLYLVREIVSAHGGRVTLESEGVGQGATINITLQAVS
jgi:two-component system phosphate regulon sensor histidine kinase PhoR